MKKLIYIFLLSFLFASCDKDESDLAVDIDLRDEYVGVWSMTIDGVYELYYEDDYEESDRYLDVINVYIDKSANGGILIDGVDYSIEDNKTLKAMVTDKSCIYGIGYNELTDIIVSVTDERIGTLSSNRIVITSNISGVWRENSADTGMLRGRFTLTLVRVL